MLGTCKNQLFRFPKPGALKELNVAGVNDFVIKFGNVNGTGSASANGFVAKSIFRMGIPIGPKNMFPSNIQGLPTWYEIRVSEKGYTARRGGVDLMVAMNPQSFAEDEKSLLPGGYLLFDSTRLLPKNARRKDIHYVELPVTDLGRSDFPVAKQRALLQNLIYVGAIAALLQIDVDIIKGLVADQFKSKPKLIPPNHRAFDIGYEYANRHFQCPLLFHLKKKDLVKDRFLIDGNSAAGLGCVYGGATVAAWYPITPSTSLADAFGRYCRKFRHDPVSKKARYAIVQAEDELAAIGMVMGATWNGARAFTATSGPGVSLMGEFLGFAYYAELPAVLFDVQRVGPSTGMPTRTQQSDLLSCAYASHGDTKHVLLIPANPKECFEFAAKAFDLADVLQTPVIVLSDLDLGMNEWLTDKLEWDDAAQWQRGKVLNGAQLEELAAKKEGFFRYLDKDGDGIPYRTLPGAHPKYGSFFTRGSGHDKLGRYTEDSFQYQENFDRLLTKFKTASGHVPKPIIRKRPGAKTNIAVAHFGTTEEALHEALDILRDEGVSLDDLRIRAFPFGIEVNEFFAAYDRIVLVEQNRDRQMATLLSAELGLDPKRLVSVLHYNGLPCAAVDLARDIKKAVQLNS